MKQRNNTSLIKHYDFLLLDLISLLLSYVIIYFQRNQGISLFHNDSYMDLLVVILLSNIIITILYEPYKNVLKRGYLKELKATFLFDLIGYSVIAVYLFVFKVGATYSRIMVSSTYVVYFVLSYLTRILWKKILESGLYNNNNKALLVVAKKKQLDDILKSVTKNAYQHYYVAAVYLIDNDSKEKGKDYKQLTSDKEVLTYVSRNRVDDIFIACDYKKVSDEVMKGFLQTGIPINLKMDNEDLFPGKQQYIDKVASYSVIRAVNKEYSNYQLLLKRLLDLVGGIVGSLIAIILMIFIGPIIYIKSPGPIIYTSDRVGKNGKIFKFYKFRSMVLNADDLKDDLRKKNRSKDQMMFKIKDDPRIIPGIGNFIRKTSLDEFPQFFNVLKGDMSLVGTRPPTMDEWEKYTPYYRSRMSIQPGITGMWQVSGRSEITDFEEVVRLDNEYINNWSFGLDIKILFMTVFKLFKRDKGAM